MRKALFLISLFIMVFLSREGFAFNISISDPIVKEKVAAGEVITGRLELTNPSSKEIKVRAYLEDFTYIAPYDGTKKFFPPGSLDFSCTGWISFSPQEFTMHAFEKKKIDYSIRVPQGVNGGNYAVLFFETSLGKIENESEYNYNVEILGRVGALFFLEAEDSIKRAEVKQIEEKNNTINGKFFNKGEVFIKSQATYYVIDEAGMVLDRGKLDDVYIFPPDGTAFNIKLSKSLAPGQYVLVCTFDLGEGDVLVKEMDFSKDLSGKIKILEIKD